MSELRAGRELDALVAEKVMGYVWSRSETAPAGWDGPNGDLLAPWRWLIQAGSPRYAPVTGGESRFINNVPKFSTDVEAAWTAVEKLVASHMKIGLTDRPDGKWGFWICRDCGQPEETTFFETGDTAPEAICLAALKAV
jgi:hypothetical protein